MRYHLGGQVWPVCQPRVIEPEAPLTVGDHVFMTIRSDVAVHTVLMRVARVTHHCSPGYTGPSIAQCVVEAHRAEPNLEPDLPITEYWVSDPPVVEPPPEGDKPRPQLRLVD